MSGWITRTEKGRWKARLRVPGGSTRSKTWNRKVDAEKWLRNELAKIDRGEWLDPKLARTGFGEWAQQWIETRHHLKPKTLLGYQSLLRTHLLPRFGPVPLSSIEPHAIEVWVTDLHRRGLSAGRTRQAHQLLSMILKAAVRVRRLSSNPATGTPLPKSPQREKRYLTAGQVTELADAVPDRYRALIYVLAYGGLRWAEAVGLKRKRVHLLRRRLEIVETLSEVGGRLVWTSPKNRQSRTVATPTFVADLLASHIGAYVKDDDLEALVFTTAAGGPVRHSNYRRRVWLPAREAIGEPELRIHNLRDTCASLLIAADAHPKAVQEHLGHSSITVTMDVYGHLYESSRDDLAERLEQQHRQSM